MSVKKYRSGALGALMDEYERAAEELKNVVSKIDEQIFTIDINPVTEDERCRSISSIISHVVDAAYRYANQMRIMFGFTPVLPEIKIENVGEAVRSIERALTFTANSVEGKWQIDDDEIAKTKRETRWGLYDVEMMFEHAIVHILRHRRQIERLLNNSSFINNQL